MANDKSVIKAKAGGRHKREFGEGPVYTITNYVLWFFAGNIYFLLLNIPLLYMLLVMLSNGKRALPEGFGYVLLLCCIPIGPAATALLSVMGKLVREKDISITRDFFKAYKINFLQSIFLWTLGILATILLLFDIRLVVAYNYPSIFAILLYAIIVFILISGLYIFPILSRFYLKTKDVIKLSLYYSFKKIHITVLNLAGIVCVGFILFKITTIIVLFMASIICYMIMYNERNVLAELQEKLKVDNDNEENIQAL